MSDAHADPAGDDDGIEGRDPAAVTGDVDSAVLYDPGTAHPPLAPELAEEQAADERG